MKLLSVFLPIRLFLIAGLSGGLLGVVLAQESRGAEVQKVSTFAKDLLAQPEIRSRGERPFAPTGIGRSPIQNLAQNSQQTLTRVTGVEVNQTESGLELILQTAAGNERLVPLILPEGNDLVIDILDATLAFSIRNGVEELNPTPGIRSVALTKVDDSSHQELGQLL